MLIESKIQREKGTVVTLDGVEYRFVPRTSKGPHVADVTKPEHIDCFLAIPEGYRMVVDGRKESLPKEAEDQESPGFESRDDGAGNTAPDADLISEVAPAPRRGRPKKVA